MKVKFLLTIDSNLRTMIKREARKHGISMNEYIETVLTQFVDMERCNVWELTGNRETTTEWQIHQHKHSHRQRNEIIS